MNNKSRREQFFILIIACIGVFGLFVLSGCGGNSCETLRCGREEYRGGNTMGISIPGCGGCLSSGKGCDSCLWPQSCKISCAEWEEGYADSDNNLITNNANIKGCDNRYYGGGCLGCGQVEKSCYLGCININIGDDKLHGFFYGTTDKDEKIMGCSNGCGGCVADGNIGSDILYEMESVEGID